MLEKNPDDYYTRPPAQYLYLLNMLGIPSNMLTEEVKYNHIQVIEACRFDYFVGTAIKSIWLFDSVIDLRSAKWHLERFGADIYHILAIEYLEEEINKIEN